ncbi:hypothetical protein APHAL10511_000039 [Amanita phalloides]|nr:hypothetical protein APHAL10511_000039 [Amanita phalloides]
MSAPALAILDEQQKSDQIALHVYTKLFHVVYQARSGETGERGSTVERGVERGDRGAEGAERPAKAKTDRWFNLETPDSDLFPRELREVYKALSATFPRAPPQLYIHVLLAVPEPGSHSSGTNNVLVALAQSNSRSGGGARIRIEPTPRYVLLETWAMTFVPSPHPLPHPHSHSPAAAQGDAVALPTIYKHGIPLFRSLYTLLRILPVWKLYKRLRRRTTGPSSSQLSIQLHVTDRDEVAGVGLGGAGSGGILLFGAPPSPAHPPLPTLTHTFPSIPHPLGSFTLSATYLESPTFQLDDLESLLSSKFISLDEGFVPTLTSKPRSETSSLSPESIAERFVIPLAAPAAVGMRQPPLGAQQLHPPPNPAIGGGGGGGGQYQHRSEGSVSGSSYSPSSPALPALSRLRLESSPGRQVRSPSLSSPSSPVAGVSPLPAHVSLPAPAPSQAQGSGSGSGSGSGLGSGLGLGLGLGPAPSISAFGMRRSSSSSSTPPPPLPLQLHTHPHMGAAMPIPFSQPPHSPYSQSSSLGSQSHAGLGSQALPIRRPSTINPFKANTVLGASASGGSPAPAGSGSGSGLVAPGTSAGSIHSLRHASSPLGPGGGGDSSSLTRSPPHATSPLMQSHSPSSQPFPTQHSPHPPFSPVPQGLSGSGSVSALGLGGLGLGLVGSGLQGYVPPSSPVPTPERLGHTHPQTRAQAHLGQQQGGALLPQSSSAPTIPTRKRYSSSFTHRYVSSGSVGSEPGAAGTGVGASPAGSTSPLGVSTASNPGVTREWGGRSSPCPEDVIGKPRSRSSSFLGKRTEDDDISLFMQDIETRKPLSGRWRMEVHEREGSGGSGGEREDTGGQGEERGRHAREATSGTDGTDSGTVQAGSGTVALEVTMKGSKGENRRHSLSPIVTTMADAPSVADANNEASDGMSSRRASYAYQPYPYQPSPLSPRPRPKPQAQSVSPVYRDAALSHARYRSQGSSSLPVATTSTSTSTAIPDTAGTPSISPPGAIPTSQAEVEVRLKKMNETFLKSLAGFGDGWASSASVQRDGGHGRSLSEGRSESGVGTGVDTGSRSPETEQFESRGRDWDRVLPSGLANLSRHGSEEVIGALELGGGGGGREYSLERAQLAAMGMGMGMGRKPPSLMRHRGL